MKYVWTRYNDHGWDCWGVFRKQIVDKAIKGPDGIPVLSMSDMIVGTTGGWDSDPIFDNDWMNNACKALDIVRRLAKMERFKSVGWEDDGSCSVVPWPQEIIELQKEAQELEE